MNVAIVGAGASGLFLAQQLSSDPELHVFIFEKNNKVGTKLRASGGGKANILNSHIDTNHYNHPDFMGKLLAKVSYNTIKEEFSDMGLRMYADSDGWVYPATLFSQTVVEVLLANMSSQVTFIYDYTVTAIRRRDTYWQIDDYKVLFDKVVLASGSPAGMIEKNIMNYNHFLNGFNLRRVSLFPSLVGFKIAPYYSFLQGCRIKTELSLYQVDKLIFKEVGEVLFKEDGISGIVVLNASAYYNRLSNKRNCYLSLNFLYDDLSFNVEKHLQKFGSLIGVLHPKLNELYCKHPFDLRDFRLHIAATYDITYAQVCSGGIALEELRDDFQLKKYNNLYAIGEMVDVDGVCGGYNLFFAFASAYIVANYIKN